ncbi:uncharacterized protein J3D65DRAFT_609280 [Phyllosticta citribraziliensis]|uniref:Uncharacterized protein n=1 Tax=Phyllosticta citribraziliensis TaxID=989973 RepID=A0ABR1M8Z7_9PEZI
MRTALFAGLRAPAHLCRLPPCLRTTTGCQTVIPKFQHYGRCASSSSATKAKKQNAKVATLEPKPFEETPKVKYLYPERLLIYNAGTGKTAFIGTYKVLCLTLFALGCYKLAPLAYGGTDSHGLFVAAILIVPNLVLLLTTLLTAPFTNSIFLWIPREARRSHENLMRYLKTLPQSARIDLITMRLSGLHKTTRTTLGELREFRGGFGAANWVRVPPKASVWAAEERRMRMGFGQRIMALLKEPRNRFAIDLRDGKSGSRSRVPGVVEIVAQKVKRNGFVKAGTWSEDLKKVFRG